MRITAGVCVLAAGLLLGVGGAAIAGADTDPSNSSGPGQGAEGTSQGVGAPAGTTADAVGNEPKAGTVEAEPAGGESTTGQQPAATLGAAGDEAENAATSDSEPVGSDFEPATPVGAEGDTTPATTVPAGASQTSAGSAATTDPMAQPPASQPAVQPVNPMTPMLKTLQPVSNAVNTWAGVLSSVPASIGELQTSQTPITDAIASVHAMLTSMVGAVGPLAQIPGDLYSLLGVPTPTAQPPLIGAGPTFDGMTVTPVPVDAPLFGPQAWHVPQLGPAAASSSLFGTMVPQPGLGAAAPAGLTQALAVSGTVPLSTATTSVVDVRSIFENVIEAVLVPASLTALAAVALPGIGGLLVVCAAGIRVGYRQAKAGLALRASGIARFAGPGPLGIVRSGSLVTLRQRARGPRTARAVCPEASRPVRALESVA